MATTPEQGAPAATVSAPTKKGLKRSTDITLSVVFLAVQFVVVALQFTLVVLFGAMVFVMSGANPLILVFMIGPVVIFLITLVVGLILMITKRNSWIATLVGMLITVVPLLLLFGPMLLLSAGFAN